MSIVGYIASRPFLFSRASSYDILNGYSSSEGTMKVEL
jgi:hypothetical protein